MSRERAARLQLAHRDLAVRVIHVDIELVQCLGAAVMGGWVGGGVVAMDDDGYMDRWVHG